MWGTLIRIKYDNFNLDQADTAYCRQLCSIFEIELEQHNNEIWKTQECCEIPKTIEQADSEVWHNAR